MDNLRARNFQRLNQAANEYNRSLLTPSPQIAKAVYLGWDAVQGLHKARLLDSSLVWGEFDSSGAAAIGQVISVAQSRGVPARFDVMPR